eukprot:5414258-Prymnesium_polylepis.1
MHATPSKSAMRCMVDTFQSTHVAVAGRTWYWWRRATECDRHGVEASILRQSGSLHESRV